MISQSESAKKQGKTTGKKKDAVKSQGNEQTLASTKAVSKLADTQGQPGKKISLQWKNQIPRAQITGKSVRDFLLCFLAGGKQADWAVAHNITKAIFVTVEPFGMKSFKAARKEMPFLSAVEMHSVPIKAPGSKFEVFSLLTEILTCPFDKKLAGSSKSDFKAQRVINPSDVVLNEQQLADNYYPGYVDEKDVPCKPPKGSVQQPASEHKDSQHTAVDSKVADSKSDRSKTSVEPILPEKKSKRMKLEDGKESKGEEEVRDSEGGKKGAKTKHVNGDGGKQGRSEAQEQEDQSERQSKSKSKKKKDKSAHDDGSASVREDADVVGSAGTTQVEVTSGAVEAKPLAIELPEYVRTKSTGGGSTSERMVAMDCEMCTTCLGLELARVSLVGEEGEVLLDEFVVPENPILDYNTLYSGITKELLQGVTNTIRDIQRRLVEIIDADTILVGHSLENDLRVCRVIHPRVIDTSVLFPHPRAPTYKNSLRYLVNKYLGRDMQRDEGHCSVDDARSTLELVLLKLVKGISFGQVGEGVASDKQLEGESLFRVLKRQVPSCRACLVANSKTIAALGTGAEVRECNNSQDLVHNVVKMSRESDMRLVVARLPLEPTTTSQQDTHTNETHTPCPPSLPLDTSDKSRDKPSAIKWASATSMDWGDDQDIKNKTQDVTANNRKRHAPDSGLGGVATTSTHQPTSVYKTLDNRLISLCKGVPAGYVICIVCPNEDTAPLDALRLQRRLSESGKSSGMPWSHDDTARMQAMVDQLRNGVGFFFVKNET